MCREAIPKSLPNEDAQGNVHPIRRLLGRLQLRERRP